MKVPIQYFLTEGKSSVRETEKNERTRPLRFTVQLSPGYRVYSSRLLPETECREFLVLGLLLVHSFDPCLGRGQLRTPLTSRPTVEVTSEEASGLDPLTTITRTRDGVSLTIYYLQTTKFKVKLPLKNVSLSIDDGHG